MSKQVKTLLASGARTGNQFTTAGEGDQKNTTFRGLIATLDLTAFTTAASLTVTIEGRVPVSG
jgi:hypothetical protein